MIGLYHLHKQEMDEACAEWCKAAKNLFDEFKTGRECYRYTDEQTGLTHKYHNLYDKIDGVSKIILKNFNLSIINHEIAEEMREAEILSVFSDIQEYLGYDGNRIKLVARDYRKNRERTMLFYYVNEALKVPFGDLYEIMRKLMQGTVFKKLGIKTCPYCNRQYTFSLIPVKDGNPGTSPEFDHFYPKSLYPTLAASFYNLVPSCHCCNHGKRQKQLYMNPYDYGFQGGFYLKDEQGNRMNTNNILSIKYEVDIHVGYDGPFEEREDVKTLGLDQLYSMHSDYVQEIIDKVNAYNRASREGLADSFQGIFHTPEQVYGFVWGRHLELAEQEKRPLSKFTKDLLEQMGVKR